MTDSSRRTREKKPKRQTAAAGAMTPLEGEILLPVRPAGFVPAKHRKEIDDWPGKHGPKALRFSAETRALVRDLAKWGIPQLKICAHVLNPRTKLPIDDHTLTKYFAKEIREGQLEGDRVTVRSLFTMMEGRPREYMRDPEGKIMFDLKGQPIILRDELKPMPAPAIFQSKVRPGVGFKETVTVEHQSAQMKELAASLEPLDESDLLQLKAILAKRVEDQQSADRARRLTGPRKPPETD